RPRLTSAHRSTRSWSSEQHAPVHLPGFSSSGRRFRSFLRDGVRRGRIQNGIDVVTTDREHVRNLQVWVLTLVQRLEISPSIALHAITPVLLDLAFQTVELASSVEHA